MVPNLASSSLENLSLENLPHGEFKLFSTLLAKSVLAIICSSWESNKNMAKWIRDEEQHRELGGVLVKIGCKKV